MLILLVALAGAWVGYREAYTERGGRPLAWRDLSDQTRPGVELTHPTGHVFRSLHALQRYLSGNMPGRVPRLPAIDFRQDEAVLVASGPRSSTGYSIRVLGVTEERGRIIVRVRERTPTLHNPVAARLTYPYRLLVFRRSSKPVEVEWQGRP